MTIARPIQAVVPAAGLGTRLRPLTDCVPKEMLPLGRAPVIEHVLVEMRQAGADAATIVLSPSKGVISQYCGDGSRWGLRCDYAQQTSMRGVGDAVLCAVPPGAQSPVLVAFGDCAILPRLGKCAASSICASARLVQAFIESGADAAVLCETVPREQTRHYGVLAPAAGPMADTEEGAPFRLAGIVEKPEPDAAPSTLAVAARWMLGPSAIEAIRRQSPGPRGEVGVTEAIGSLIAEGGHVIGVPLGDNERRCDVGNVRSYLVAQVFASLNDAEYGMQVRQEVAMVRRSGAPAEV